MYAVIDAETTGISQDNDRIIEFAVIGLNSSGEKEWEWCSLINPKRNTGNGFAVQIHQIYPEDVENAPPFDDIAGDLVRILTDRVIIGHNAQFDLGMLGAEYARLDYQMPELVHICTAAIARDAGFRPYRLEACCEALSIEMDGMHHALADARATVCLAQQLFDFSNTTLRKDVELRLKSCTPWQDLPIHDVKLVTRRIFPVRKSIRRRVNDLNQVRAASRASSNNAPVFETFSIKKDSVESRYLAAVEWVLEDREISVEQQNALDNLRTELNLSDGQVHDIHMTFIRGLAGSMWKDGVISNHEQFDLDMVGELLILSAENVEYARSNPIGLSLVNEDYILHSGDVVVFTGEMSVPRPEWKDRAKASGLRVTGSVSKKTNYLVVPFGKTGSGKSRRARDLGISVVSEQRFRRMIDRLEEQYAT